MMRNAQRLALRGETLSALFEAHHAETMLLPPWFLLASDLATYRDLEESIFGAMRSPRLSLLIADIQLVLATVYCDRGDSRAAQRSVERADDFASMAGSIVGRRRSWVGMDAGGHAFVRECRAREVAAVFKTGCITETEGDFLIARAIFRATMSLAQDDDPSFPEELLFRVRALACSLKEGEIDSAAGEVEDCSFRLNHGLIENPSERAIGLWSRWHAIYRIRTGLFDGTDEMLAHASDLLTSNPKENVLTAFATAHLYLAKEQEELGDELFRQASSSARELGILQSAKVARAAVSALLPGPGWSYDDPASI